MLRKTLHYEWTSIHYVLGPNVHECGTDFSAITMRPIVQRRRFSFCRSWAMYMNLRSWCRPRWGLVVLTLWQSLSDNRWLTLTQPCEKEIWLQEKRGSLRHEVCVPVETTFAADCSLWTDETISGDCEQQIDRQDGPIGPFSTLGIHVPRLCELR